MLAKYDRFKNGDKNAFIDPAGYKAYIADREQAFEAELKKQSAEQTLIAGPPPRFPTNAPEGTRRSRGPKPLCSG